MFAWLLGLEWVAGIVAALWISPRTWYGEESVIHLNVWASIFLGALITGFPMLLAVLRPGEALTRHVVAIGQILTSALLIHLTGGRIETHFHVFGSLTFLAFYRDWRVLLTATIVVALDHALRGIFWPQSVFGVLAASNWRWMEHAAWVLFEDTFLWIAIWRSVQTMRGLAERQARLEAVNVEIEQRVTERTAELRQENAERQRAETELISAHKNLVAASRTAGMAEIATNVIHNVGNVLNSVNVSAGLVAETVKKSKAAGLVKAAALLKEHEDDLGAFLASPQGGQFAPYLEQLATHLMTNQELTLKELAGLQDKIDHVKEIVVMQQSYARVSGVREVVELSSLAEDSLRLNTGALTRHQIDVVREFQPVPSVNIDKHKVLQILTNLVRNAKYACDDSANPEKKLILRVYRREDFGCIEVKDTGIGIPEAFLTRIFQHGFTTRPGGHGFGLHSSALAAKELGGSISVHSDGPGRGATFTLEIPLNLTEAGA